MTSISQSAWQQHAVTRISGASIELWQLQRQA